MYSILVVDDEASIRKTLIELLRAQRYRVTGIATVIEALNRIKEEAYDLIITDLRIGNMSGMEILKAAKQMDPTVEVIVLTGYGTIESSVEAMKLGAYDYILKPLGEDEFIMRVERALSRKQMTEEIERLRQYLRKDKEFETIIAESKKMQEILQLVAKIGKSDSPIMLQGESGTGKELVARAIHRTGRPDGSFVPINCSALPETLLESELFGYMKGAFTGATINKKGLFEEAHGGTLFLDEIGDMSALTQVRLFRALDIGEVRRLGSNTQIYVNARLVTATNKNLQDMVAKAEFREELYYRLNVISIIIPPLRERREDIIPLAEHFLKLYSAKMNRNVSKISPEAAQFMLRYEWPGNVRELENAIERAVVLAQEDIVTLEDLPFGSQMQQPNILHKALQEQWDLKRLEKEHILNIMAGCSWNHSQASKKLGIARNTLWRKLKEYEVG